MQVVGQPMQCPELGLSPEQAPGMPLSKEMIQALSLVCGYWQNQRVVCKASPGGVLFTASPQLTDIVHYTATEASYNKQGDDIQCTEVLCMAHPDNSDKVWVRSHKAATTDNAWPLNRGEVVKFSISNLSMLHMLIVADTEKLIVGYTM